jgi:hypothetical protein
MATKGYQTYRGRMPGWKKFLIALLIIVLCGAVAFIFFQPSQVFDADGVHFQLPKVELPELPQVGGQQVSASDGEAEEPSDLEGAGQDEELIIDIQEPEPPKLTPLYGRTITTSKLQSGDFSALQEGEEAVVVMKAANGWELFAADAESAEAEAVRQNLTGRSAVAQISCYADTRAADNDNSMAVMSVSGKAWRDPNGNARLDPYNTEVTAYLIEQVQQCVALGFTEIVLDDAQFPNYGRLDRVDYSEGSDSPQQRIDAINAMLEAVKASLGEDSEVKLSILLPSTLLETGRDENAGWDLSAIAQRVDRIYMAAADQAAADSTRATLAALNEEADGESFYVAIVSSPITGGSYIVQ